MAEGIFSRIGSALMGRDEAPAAAPESEAPDTGEVIGKRAIPTQTVGTSMSGYGAGETYYADRNLSLNGSQRWDKFEDMLRDIAIVAAGARLFLNVLANAVWQVVPPDDLNDNELAVAEGYAEQAYDMLFDMITSWSTVVKKTAMFRLMGFSLLEWTAKKRPDGAIGLLDIGHRPQRTITKWVRDTNGTVTGVKQRVLGRSEVEIPRAKLVYAVDDTFTDEPEGLGLFRHLAATVERLRIYQQLEETGFTTDLRGIPIARAPLGELQAEVHNAGPPNSEPRAKAESRRQRMLQPLREFIEKHIRNKETGALLPSDTFSGKNTDGGTAPSAVPKWGLELLNGDSQSFEAIAAAIKEAKQDLARILGTEHLLLGADGTGSLALARSKVGTFLTMCTGTLYDLVEVYDRDILEPLAELNGWEEHLRPQMAVNEISDRDIEQVMVALRDLATAGCPMMPGDPAEGEVYEMLGLTAPPERSEADLSLNPGRRDPMDPDNPMPKGGPEQGIAKRNLIKSRSRRPWRKAA